MSKALLRRLEAIEASLASNAVKIVLWRGGEADSFVIVQSGGQTRTETRQNGETSAAFLRRVGAH